MRGSQSRSPPYDIRSSPVREIHEPCHSRAKRHTVQRRKEIRGKDRSKVADSNFAFGTYFGGRPRSQANLGFRVDYFDQSHNASVSFIAPNQINTGAIAASFSGSSTVTESPQTFSNTGTVSATAGGTITINPTSGQASSNSGSINAATGGTITFSSGLTQTAGNTNVAGSLNLGTGGSGVLNLNGGTLTGSGGTITGTVNVNSGGTINPGNSPGSMTINGNYNLAGGTETVELGGYGQGTTYDYLNVTGSASLNGILQISLYSGFLPSDGDIFYFLDYGSQSGNYTQVLRFLLRLTVPVLGCIV